MIIAIEYWNRVIFTDDIKYNIYGFDERCTTWRKENEELKPKLRRNMVEVLYLF